MLLTKCICDLKIEKYRFGGSNGSCNEKNEYVIRTEKECRDATDMIGKFRFGGGDYNEGSPTGCYRFTGHTSFSFWNKYQSGIPNSREYPAICRVAG